MIIETVVIGNMQANCYILAVAEGRSAIIIDPGADEEKIRAVLQKYALRPALIINTHGHYDHIGCNDKFGVFVYVHKLEKPLLKDPKKNLSVLFDSPMVVSSKIKTVDDGEIISLDEIELKALHIPGHSPGGLALYLQKPQDKTLFSGDNLFFRGIGRTDFPGGDHDLLVKSIKKKIFTLPPDTMVLPGHGARTTVGDEKGRNFFLRDT